MLKHLQKQKLKAIELMYYSLFRESTLQFFLPTISLIRNLEKLSERLQGKGLEVHAYYSEFARNKIVLRGKLKVEL